MIIPRAMQKLVSELAENIHENWAKSKIGQGYKYNKVKNEIKREVNC